MGSLWARIALLALLFDCACHRVPRAVAAAAAVRKGASKEDPPGAVFFHKGDDALAWDSDELTHVRLLHSKDFHDKKAFQAAPDVATYLGLPVVEALHMPVPLSIVFVGFQGDGNMDIDISTDQLQEWFGQLDHVLPHTRVELSKLTCAEDGHCAGLVHASRQHQPVPSFVHLNFSCNVVVTRRKAVVTAFQRAQHVFSRPVDPDLEMGAQQVDALKMESFVSNFLQSLGLSSSYSLLVLNTPWSVDQPVYGYRQGLSRAEMDVVLGHGTKVQKMMGSAFATEPQLPFPYSASGWLTGGNGKERSSTKKFGSTDATWNSDFWVQSVEHYLTSEEEYRKALLQEVGTLRGAAAVVQAVRLLRRGDTAMAGVLKNEVLAGPGEGLNMFSKFHTMHPAEDCLVGNWVGAGRWALLDLTAGGGDWGPAMGGDGVVHRHTVPSVMDHFSRLHILKQNVREVRKSEEDKALLQQVGAQAAAQGGETGRLAFQVFNREMQARRMAASAPGSAPLSDAVGTLKDPEEAVRWQRKYQETLLRSELDVYEQTARRHCNPELRVDLLPAVCQELKQRTEKARSQLAKLASAQGIPGDIWRDHKWDIFGHEADEHWEEDMEVSEEALRSHDLFLAELAALLSRALRHVVAPPTATWTHAAGYLHDTATPFATNVRFEIFVIRDTAREMQLHVDPGSSSFDIHSYQDMVSSLKLGNQHFSFKQHFLTLSSDPLLATAFSSALRVSHQHIPADEDALQETERLYLDSRALAHVLRQRFEVSSPGGEQELPPLDSEGIPAGGAWRRRIAARSKQRRTRVKGGAAGHAEHHVPVFVFEVHRDVAVLIDEHYNAKALEDMVLVVQNAARDDEHPTGMMCGGALLARPLSPLKEALSATLTHLGGVLPPHLGYNPAKDRVTHDWLWSVGAHVQSFTSVGTRFTELQRDALARSYLLDGLDSAVDAVNAGVLLLRGTHTTPLVHSHLLKNKAAMLELLGCWQFLVDHWRLVMAAAWSLDWDKATDMLAGIEDHALRFRQLAEVLSTIPHGGDCMGVVKPSLSVMLVLPTLVASAAVAGAALLYVVLPLVCGSSQASSKQRFRLN